MMVRPDDAGRASIAKKSWVLAYALLAKRRQARERRNAVLLAVLQATLEEEQSRAPRRKVCGVCAMLVACGMVYGCIHLIQSCIGCAFGVLVT